VYARLAILKIPSFSPQIFINRLLPLVLIICILFIVLTVGICCISCFGRLCWPILSLCLYCSRMV
jgi:hypothetical protein